ncbi:methyltransferase domain-containing protein [Georgenia satyanarayanai]|uniref:methyltransferase domain-containing protein n=1 Tax=Georgenia satyanarayanai TaxID=860221 RepID=UPI001264B5A3|nr:methyltransferase domain-containing protein [Georgenia satyanarayanai]
MSDWDRVQYARFAGARGRPFRDLLAQVDAVDPRTVVDLGCGSGELTATLAERWPGAEVVGVDSSPDMVTGARALPAALAGRLTVEEADLRAWVAHRAPGSCDVVVSNAALQWVPDHLGLLPALVDLLAPGGRLAVQIPGNHDAPSHRILRELAGRYGVPEAARRPAVPGPDDYLGVLGRLGCAVDAWETTYLHVLSGPDPVWEWVRGTGARPLLHALPDGRREEFAEEYRARLREAYPAEAWGTVLPFRRVFAVAVRR